MLLGQKLPALAWDGGSKQVFLIGDSYVRYDRGLSTVKDVFDIIEPYLNHPHDDFTLGEVLKLVYPILRDNYKGTWDNRKVNYHMATELIWGGELLLSDINITPKIVIITADDTYKYSALYGAVRDAVDQLEKEVKQ